MIFLAGTSVLGKGWCWENMHLLLQGGNDAPPGSLRNYRINTGPATRENIDPTQPDKKGILEKIGESITENDLLLIVIFSHGGKSSDNDYDGHFEVFWDDETEDYYGFSEFAESIDNSLMNKDEDDHIIPNSPKYGKMVIMLQHCFSGRQLIGPHHLATNDPNNRVILTATDEDDAANLFGTLPHVNRDRSLFLNWFMQKERQKFWYSYAKAWSLCYSPIFGAWRWAGESEHWYEYPFKILIALSATIFYLIGGTFNGQMWGLIAGIKAELGDDFTIKELFDFAELFSRGDSDTNRHKWGFYDWPAQPHDYSMSDYPQIHNEELASHLRL